MKKDTHAAELAAEYAAEYAAELAAKLAAELAAEINFFLFWKYINLFYFYNFKVWNYKF